ncbi:MAG: protein phosphatase 2C domain-containing protein [Polyangiaceae bacterium]|nr:protein phosphatase 2C domain-containing protein [Polyangiaceae bacterium]
MERRLLRAFGKTDLGLVRETNEDAFGMIDLSTGQRWQRCSETPIEWFTTPAGVLLSVSDGMGGAKAGEVASALSVESVLDGMLSAAQLVQPNGETLRHVVERASQRVYEAGRRRADRKGMGATLTAVLLSGTMAYVAQIGDSRAYLLRSGQIGQITRDQSYVQLLVDAGVMTPEEASSSPRRNVILQVMGQEAVRVALGRIDVRAGDRLLLCSDGLTNFIDDETLNLVAKAPNHLGLACQELVTRTLDIGAPDNVTVIVAEVA